MTVKTKVNPSNRQPSPTSGTSGKRKVETGTGVNGSSSYYTSHNGTGTPISATIRLSVNRSRVGKLAEDDSKWGAYNGKFKAITLTVEQLEKEVQAGYGFTAVLKGYRKTDNFDSAQHIALDFDTKDERSSLDRLMQDPFISTRAALLYTTASHTPEKPRARVVFFLDEPVTDPKLYVRLVTALIEKFSLSDPHCKDAARLFFGAPGCETRVLGRVLPVKTIEALSTFSHSDRKPTEPLPDRLGEGERNEKLLSLAGSMRHRNAAPEAILAALMAENETRCDPPLSEEEVRGIARGITRYKTGSESRPWTDLGNAERLIDAHGRDIRYSQELGWLCWDGRRWKIDNNGSINRLMNSVVRSIRQEAASEPDKGKSESIFKHAIKSESASAISAALRLAQTLNGIPIQIDDLDNSDWLVNFKNGTLDLELNKLREHRREDYITKLIPCNFNPEADCPTFRQTISLAFNGNQALIEYMQEALGYSLSGTHDEKAIFILHGKTGNNGKSTIMESFGWAFGDDYAGTIDPTVLTVGPKDSFRLGSIASTRGKRFIASNEMQSKQSLDPGTIKQWSGMDRVHGKDLYKKEFDFFQKGKLWIRTNDVPKISDNSDPLWNRLKLMPFNNRITPENGERPRAEIDKQLKKEREGILAYAYKGHLRWRERGNLLQPPEVTAAVKEYRTSQDTFSQFLENRYELGSVTDKSFNMTLAQVVSDFKVWCSKEGLKQVKTSNQEVRKMVNQQHGLTMVTQLGQWHVLGIRVPPGVAEAEAKEEERRQEAFTPTAPKPGVQSVNGTKDQTESEVDLGRGQF